MSDLGAANVVINGTDATGPAFNSVRTGLQGVGTQADLAAAKLTGSGKGFIESLQRQAEQIGKTRSEIAAFQAQQLGVAAAAEPYIARLRAAEQGTTRLGVSAAQTAAALRGVPAQFTDIVTSLQGGQAPLTVFLQQGGQLKDMFGGAGPAAKALGGYIGGLINPLTVTAAAVAALGLAYYQASERDQEFRKSLITTGNFAGTSAAGLQDLTAKVAGVIGSQGQAAEALTALAGTGRIAGESLRGTAEAAVYLEKVGGVALKDSIETFVRLGEEPTKASAKLNESLHYLTLETYERIRTLEDQGQKEAAAALAQDTYAKSTVSRMQQVRNESGYLAQALSFAGDAAKNMWASISQGVADVGKAPSLARMQEELQKARTGPLAGSPFEVKRVAQLEAQIRAANATLLRENDKVAAEGQLASDNQAKIAASTRWKEMLQNNRTQAEIRKDLIEKTRADGKLLNKTQKEIDDEIANINAKHKDPKAPGAKTFREDAGTKMLEQLRQQGAATSAQLETSEKLTTAEGERAKFNQLITDLKGKGQLTAEQKSLVNAQDAIRAQFDVNVALEKQLATKKAFSEEQKKQAEAEKVFDNLIQATNIRIDESLKGQKEQYDRQLDVFGLGSQAAERLQSTKAIRKEFQNLQAGLAVSAAKNNTLESDKYQGEVARIQQSLSEALKLNDDYYNQLDAKRTDWKNGASTALQNYLDDVRNVAKGTEEAFTNAFKSAEDSLTSFIMTGKLNGGDLLKSLAEQGVRQFVRQDILGPAGKFLQSNGIFGKGVGEAAAKVVGDSGASTAKAAAETAAATATGGFTTTLTSSVPLVATALQALTTAATTAAASLSGASGGAAIGMLGGGTGLLTSVANAMPGNSLDNLLNLTGGFGTIPKFAVGTDFVPHDMIAQIHKGERIVRAADNTPSAGSGDTYHYNFTVGDVPTMSTVRQAIASSERRVVGGLGRSRDYGGRAA